MESSTQGLGSSYFYSQTCDVQEEKDKEETDKYQEQLNEGEQGPRKSTGLVVGPELLAGILNKKKMELFQSPEVKDFFTQQQSKLSRKAEVSEYNKKGKKDSSDNDTCDSQRSDPSNTSSPMR